MNMINHQYCNNPYQHSTV